MQSWRVSHRARAEPCRQLARRERVRRSRLSPTKRKCRLGEATGKILKAETLKSKKSNRTCNGGSSFDFLSEANHLPAAAGASLRVSFMPDPAPEIIRQPERLECANDIQTPEGVQRTRGVAKGTPRMTLENQWWRAGARQQTALAGCEGMSVRHTRVRPNCSQMETVNCWRVRIG